MKVKVLYTIALCKIKTLIQKNKSIVIGSKSMIFWKSKLLVMNGGKIYIGDNSVIGRSSLGYHAGMPFYTSLLADTQDSYISIGNNCRLNGVYIHAQKSIKIGDNCVIASGVNIIDSNGHETVSLNRTKGRDKPEAIVIGNNVWIGLNSIILKGSKIGDNSIISAGSVIKGTFPENSLITSHKDYSIKKLDIV